MKYPSGKNDTGMKYPLGKNETMQGRNETALASSPYQRMK